MLYANSKGIHAVYHPHSPVRVWGREQCLHMNRLNKPKSGIFISWVISLLPKDLLFRTYEPPHDKTNKMSVRPAKTQISLGIRPVWSESLLCTQWVAKDPSVLHADNEDSDQTGRMPRLVCVFAGRTVTLLVLSCCGSYLAVYTKKS